LMVAVSVWIGLFYVASSFLVVILVLMLLIHAFVLEWCLNASKSHNASLSDDITKVLQRNQMAVTENNSMKGQYRQLLIQKILLNDCLMNTMQVLHEMLKHIVAQIGICIDINNIHLSEQDISKAYRSIAHWAHLDQGGSPQQFRLITESRDLLLELIRVFTSTYFVSSSVCTDSIRFDSIHRCCCQLLSAQQQQLLPQQQQLLQQLGQ